MSGHSKWSKVKHQKATTDALKSGAFTKASRSITLAVREGGGITDPDSNFHLRLAIEKARDVNMPKENIVRAIERGKKDDGTILQSVTYEGYGPHGIALYIEAVTDNINRTVSQIKQFLEYAGGTMASPGAVSYLFRKRGLIVLPKTLSYDELFNRGIDLGADDIIELDDVFEVYTNPMALSEVKKAFELAQLIPEMSRIIMDPITVITLEGDKKEKVQALIEQLESLDDVQNVYSNGIV